MKKIFLFFSFLLVSGMLSAVNLFNPATTTIESWCMPNWQGAQLTNVATYNNGTITVTVPGNCSAQWQCQVKLQTQDITLDATKTYSFSCTMHSNKAVSLVTVKVFDDSELSNKNSHSLVVGDNTVTNPTFNGGSTGNGIIVFDFGYAEQGTVVTISNITLEETTNGGGTVTPTEPDDEGYSLVWNADFATSASLPSNWNVEVNGDGGGNNELQYYCQKGVSIGTHPTEGKKCLILTATKESYQGKGCTSGRVNSKGNTYFKYGKIEARIHFPNTANGLWPAFWMMGNNYDQVGWPACGETDIIELGHSNGFSGNNQDRYFNGASHWGPRWDQHYQYANSITNSYSVEDGFHIITCIWTPEKVAMYVDKDAHPGVGPYYEMSIPQSADMADTNPGKYFHVPNFIIFNLAVGGNFPGIYNINNVSALQNGPRSMYVDWVRVYQRGDAGESFYSSIPSEAIEGGATAVEQTENTESARKIIRNGQIIILRGDKAYTLTGEFIY